MGENHFEKQTGLKSRQWVNYKTEEWFENEALPGFEPGISCLLDRRFNR